MDAAAECARYGALLEAEPVHLCCLGIGENGHIAFNDPPVCDFFAKEAVAVLELDAACRAQQVGEGWFADLAAVPTHAFTLTPRAILAAQALSCVVPDARKAAPVKAAVLGPVSRQCPASILQAHPNCRLWLDPASASLLPDHLRQAPAPSSSSR